MMHADRSIPGWFQEIVRNHLIVLMRKHDVRVVLEVGAFLGKSTIFFAERCHLVYSVDYWDTDCLASEGEKQLARELGLPREFKQIWNDNLKQAADNHPYGTHFAPCHWMTPNEFPDILRKEPPDLVFIDGNHAYDAVRKDLETYGSLAKKVICGDDYLAAPGVTQAVDEVFGANESKVHTAPPFWWVEAGPGENRGSAHYDLRR